MRRSIIIGAAAALVLVLSTEARVHAEETSDAPSTPVFVDEDGDGINDAAAFRHRFGMRRGRGFERGMGSAEVVWIGTQLTGDQKAAVQEKVDAMRGEDATREDIHAAVGEMLVGYGVELPEDGSWRLGLRGGGGQVWISTALTEEQQATLQEKVDQLRAEGASWEDIRAATAGMLAGFGIAISEDASWRMGRGRDGGLGRLSGLLTEEQQAAIQVKIDELREAGATRADIHAAIEAELGALGIEMPAMGERGGRHGRGGRRGKMGRK